MLPFPINHRWDNQRIESGILLFIAAANTLATVFSIPHHVIPEKAKKEM